MLSFYSEKMRWERGCCFRIVGALAPFGEQGPKKTQIQKIMIRETQKIIQSLQLIISNQMMPYSYPKVILRSCFTCFRVFEALAPFGERDPNRTEILQIMVREIQKVIESFQFIISHQMMPDSNAKVI